MVWTPHAPPPLDLTHDWLFIEPVGGGGNKFYPNHVSKNISMERTDYGSSNAEGEHYYAIRV